MSEFSEIAGKMQIIQDLIDTNIYDDDGNVIGQKEPEITQERALELFKAIGKD